MKRFLRSRRGAVAVEFALIIPVFVCALAMCLEVSRVQIASMLLERAAYDIAYQARLKQGVGLQAIAASVLERRSLGLFDPKTVTVSARSDKDVRNIATGGSAGSGEAASVVHLQLTANLSLFQSLVPEPLQLERTIDFFYMNEPDLEPR